MELNHEYQGLSQLNNKLQKFGIQLRDSRYGNTHGSTSLSSSSSPEITERKEKEIQHKMKRYGIIALLVGCFGLCSM